jgi:hypothetical protein
MTTRSSFIPRRNSESDHLYENSDDNNFPLEMSIPGLACNGENGYNLKQNGVIYKVRCDTEVLNEARERPWYPLAEPYSMARPHSDIEKKTRRLSNRIGKKEKFNYAKALLESDIELERLAQKICSQIRESEMLEVAFLAQEAADAGVETFSGKPSTFEADPIPVTRPPSYTGSAISDASDVDNGKINARDLRRVSEVIPEFNSIHAHMRTHLFRRKVDEKTLVFEEIESSSAEDNKQEMTKEKSGSDSVRSDIARHSINLLQAMRIRISKTGTRDFVEENKSGSRSIYSEDATSQSLVSEESDQYGAVLSPPRSYVESGKNSKSESLDTPPGLDQPGKMTESMDSMNHPDKLAESSNSISTERISSIKIPSVVQPGEDNNGDMYISDFAVPAPHMDEKEVEVLKETVSLFDKEEDNDDHLYSSPQRNSQTMIMHPPYMMTPRIDDYFNHGSDFMTPERLRDIKGERKDVSEQKVTTPEVMKYRFSPGSIIESSNGVDQDSPRERRKNVLRDEDTKYLELPTIKDGESSFLPPNASSRASVLSRTRTRSIRIPNRSLGGNDVDSKEENESYPQISNESAMTGVPSGNSANIDSSPQNLCERQPDEKEDSYVDDREQGKELEVTKTEGKGPVEKVESTRSIDEIGFREANSMGMISPSWSTRASDKKSEKFRKRAKRNTLEKLIAKLSPRSRREAKNCFKDTENNEFLDNYLYCARPKERSNMFVREKYSGRLYCADTFVGQNALCHGVDTVCNGLDYLFPKSRQAGNNSRARARTLSIDRSNGENQGWLDTITKRRFGIGKKSIPGADDKTSAHFSPPDLKTSVPAKSD